MKIICLLLFFCTINFAFSQGIKISENGSIPDATAILELESENQGFLPPRLTTVQRDAITSPAEGLVIYNIDTKCINFYNAASWIDLCDAPSVPFPTPSSCGDVFADTRDGQNYTTVEIGNQCWMAENLNYEVTDSYCYDNDPVNCDIHGRLYGWATIMDGSGDSNTNPSNVQGICPEGWHVPSDAEWIEMEEFLGMTSGQTSTGWRTDGSVGLQLKATTFGGNNSSGFNALGSGRKSTLISPPFSQLNTITSFWSTSVIGFQPIVRTLNTNFDGIMRDLNDIGFGTLRSLRCIRD